MKSVVREAHLRKLEEEEAIAVVVDSVRQLFPVVTERQSREPARRVLHALASRGVTLAVMPRQDSSD
jgi:hypothetical protein